MWVGDDAQSTESQDSGWTLGDHSSPMEDTGPGGAAVGMSDRRALGMWLILKLFGFRVRESLLFCLIKHEKIQNPELFFLSFLLGFLGAQSSL